MRANINILIVIDSSGRPGGSERSYFPFSLLGQGID